MSEREQSRTAGAAARQRPLAPAPARVYDSHEIHADRSITFRLDAPHAQSVSLVTDLAAQILPLTKSADGLWSITTPPLEPAIYAYAFTVDGVDQADPRNAWVKTSLVSHASLVMIPGASIPGMAARPWEPTAVAHGTLHSHVYTTATVEGLPAKQSRYVVYTPAGYSADAERAWPVLYLLHGWSDAETAWTQIGQAHLILDALIDAGAAQPMVAVMPLGYGQMSFVEMGIARLHDAGAMAANAAGFERALLEEIVPQVATNYQVRRDREGRAIAGQSMGGLQSLLVGLNHADAFAWVGGFSSAVSVLESEHAAELLRGLRASAARPKLVWLTCGVDDPLLEQNRRLIPRLQQEGVAVTAVETPGGHAWTVWREALVRLLPLLFANDVSQ
jgi:enterochelin esterase family protein